MSCIVVEMDLEGDDDIVIGLAVVDSFLSIGEMLVAEFEKHVANSFDPCDLLNICVLCH